MLASGSSMSSVSPLINCLHKWYAVYQSAEDSRLLWCLHTRSKYFHGKVKFAHGCFLPLRCALGADGKEGCFVSWWRPRRTTCCPLYLCEVALVTNVFEVSTSVSKLSTWQANDVHSQVMRAYYCHLTSRRPSVMAFNAWKKQMRHVTLSQAGHDAVTKMCEHLNVEHFQAQWFNVRAMPRYYWRQL